jgi:hypothetical protein
MIISTMHKTLTAQRRVLGVGGSNFFTACGVRDGRFFTTSAMTPREVKRVAMMEKLTG